MAIFSGKGPEAPAGRGGETGSAETALSVIAYGMRLVGDIESRGVVKIEGTIEGSIKSARQVLLGRQGEIIGDISARDVVVGGRVSGTVVATERIEIQGTAAVHGDIYTKTIIVLEGGNINGTVHMSDDLAMATEDTPVAIVR